MRRFVGILERLMDELSHADKAVLLLYLDDVGYDEMALILGATGPQARYVSDSTKSRSDSRNSVRRGNSMSLEDIKREWRDQMDVHPAPPTSMRSRMTCSGVARGGASNPRA